MRTFKDALHREWSIDVGYAERKAVREATEIDLFAVFDGELGQKISDPGTLVDVMYVVCKPQATERGIDFDKFARGFRGDTLEQAADALFGSIADYLPQKQRDLLNEAMARGKQANNEAFAELMAKLPTMMANAKLAITGDDRIGMPPRE